MATSPTHPGTSARTSAAGLASRLAAGLSGIHKIQHVVVIMQENRSFDEYFGTFPGANGIPMHNGVPTVCSPDPATGKCYKPFHDYGWSDGGGPHHAYDAVADINGGRMDGFVAQALHAPHTACTPGDHHCHAGIPDVMGYKTAQEIPNYWAYARHFVLQDAMFEPTCVVERARAPLHGLRLVGQVLGQGRPHELREQQPRAGLGPLRHQARARLRVDGPHLAAQACRRELALLRGPGHPA